MLLGLAIGPMVLRVMSACRTADSRSPHWQDSMGRIENCVFSGVGLHHDLSYLVLCLELLVTLVWGNMCPLL